MAEKSILLHLTLAQANALSFACTNALLEPANFERGTGNERLEAPLGRVHDKISAALSMVEKIP